MIDAYWMQEQFYRRVVTRYEGVQHGGMIYFDSVLPFNDIISMTVAMQHSAKTVDGVITAYDEARAFFENRLHPPRRWACTLWLQGYGTPRRSKPAIEWDGNEDQMIEDIFVALLKI